MALPPCGLYRTTAPVSGVPAGRLVYFHNHGDPGPGLYLPSGWSLNRAQWHRQGHTLTEEALASTLVPLPAEGLYMVRDAFFCCESRCRNFPQRQLVQLGYDGAATPLLFLPEMMSRGLGFPERGLALDAANFGKLQQLVVAEGVQGAPDTFLH